MGKHFVEQMFSGMAPIGFRSQIFRRHRSAQFDSETPATLVNGNTGNQFRMVTNGQPHGAGGHLKNPAIANRHVHLFAGHVVNRHQQRISRGQKFVRFTQLIQMKGNRNLGKGRNPVFQPSQSGAGFRLSIDNGCNWKFCRPKPGTQQKKWAKMAKGQDDRTAIPPGLPQTVKSRDATTAHPFGFRQPLREIIQHVIHITTSPPSPDGADRLCRADTIRQRHGGR